MPVLIFRISSPVLLRAALLACALYGLAGCWAIALQQGQQQSAPAPQAASPSPPPFAAPPAGADARSPAADETIKRPTSGPYTGDLSIFEDPRRAQNLQIERVMDLLKIGEGTNVADIGAGSGWFTVRAARRVGARGTVFAVDINQDFLKHIEERSSAERLTNVRTVLGKEDDPLLPENSVDSVLLLKTYHEIAQPVRLLARLRRALRTGALVGVIDRNGHGDDHGIDRETVIEEARRAGYALVEQYDFVKPDGMDYFLIFGAGK